ncbi:hypothetical protein DUI87_11523 [Hirundo rustica rustica]|uniref:Uncharacterized protein n=1 Tax=Hirundo rustica rustica TaxID=333673 RepID=A0A3M0KJM1_HIRRU|nr:hypothetical protein DUI87_11523 [Hirundo rustica rustica]
MEQGFTSRAEFSQWHSDGIQNVVIYTAPYVSVNLSESSMGLHRPQDKAWQQEEFEFGGLEPIFGLLLMTIHSHNSISRRECLDLLQTCGEYDTDLYPVEFTSKKRSEFP